MNVLLPAIVTIIGNIIFYLWIKGKVDNSIERYKIAYSGIFKERIDIYKEILKQIFEIKFSIQQYQYFGTSVQGEKIMSDLNKFINYYLVNQPFLSDKMMSELKKIREEFQSIFDDFYLHHKVTTKPGVDPDTMTKLINNFFKAGNKLKGDEPFKILEETIISEMRTHLQIDTL